MGILGCDLKLRQKGIFWVEGYSELCEPLLHGKTVFHRTCGKILILPQMTVTSPLHCGWKTMDS